MKKLYLSPTEKAGSVLASYLTESRFSDPSSACIFEIATPHYQLVYEIICNANNRCGKEFVVTKYEDYLKNELTERKKIKFVVKAYPSTKTEMEEIDKELMDFLYKRAESCEKGENALSYSFSMENILILRRICVPTNVNCR